MAAAAAVLLVALLSAVTARVSEVTGLEEVARVARDGRRSSSGAQVLRYELDTNQLPDYYRFSYDSSDGSSRTEEGQINDLGTPQAALHVFGTTRWVGQNGGVYEMSYKAGKRGYRTIIRKISR